MTIITYPDVAAFLADQPPTTEAPEIRRLDDGPTGRWVGEAPVEGPRWQMCPCPEPVLGAGRFVEDVCVRCGKPNLAAMLAR